MTRSHGYEGKHRDRRRRLLVVPLLILSLVSLQTTLAVAGGDKADKQAEKAAKQEQKENEKAAKEREKIEKECRERKHKDQGQNPTWRAENNCPEDGSASDDKASDKGSKSDEKKAKDEAKQEEKQAKDEAKQEEKQAKDEAKQAGGGSGSSGTPTTQEKTGSTISPSSTSTSGGSSGSTSLASTDPVITAAAQEVNDLSVSKVTGEIGGGLASVLEVVILGNQYAEYFFVFADGVTVSGIATSNDWQIRSDFSQTTHLSCSDPFTGGYASKGSPDQSLGEPQILTYHITRYKLNSKTGEYAIHKECGATIVPPIDISIVKTNDANGDSTYSDSEIAPSAGASVPFKAVITNNSSVPVVLDTLTDVYPGVSTFGVCGGLIGTTLAAGASTTCTFTVSGYAPAAGESLTDTVTVTGHHATIPSITDSASDTSTVSTPVAAPEIDIQVVKTNDANGNGTYTDDEVAPSEGAAVPFKAVITNNSDVAVVITSLTDVFGSTTIDPIACGGGSLIGTVLAAGGSVTCTFTLNDYAPAPGDSKVNTVTVIGAQQGDPTNTDTDSDTSTVSTPELPPVIDISIVKTNDADGDASYNDSEEAPSEGAAVPFQAVITNNSDVAVVITSLTDAFGSTTITDVGCEDDEGDDVLNLVLAAGASVTCTFTLDGYAPAPGDSKLNTLTVVAAEQGTPTNTDTDSDTSTVSTPELPPVIDISVVKTNDADGDASYNDSEIAPSEGAAVPFKAVITNDSDVPVVITSLTDAFGSTTIDPIACAGGSLIGTVLAAGGSVTCTFTLSGYAPPAGDAKINTVTVIGAQQGAPDNTDTDSDTSTVLTQSAPEILTIDVDKVNDADEDGTYSDTEEAAEEGAPVTFRATITNTSQVAVKLISLSDIYPGVSAFAICPELIGTVIAPAGSVTCSFTVDGYAPEADGSLTDTVTATVEEDGDPSNQVSDADDSTVTTPEVLPRIVERPKDGKKVLGGLAFTGAGLTGLLMLAAALMLSGAAFAFLGRKRRREGNPAQG